MFFKKRKKLLEENKDENRKRIDDLELEIEKIKSHIISLRGFVNRRMSGEDLPTETIKSVDGLDVLRK